jgi:hypothetical protein
MLWSVQPVPCCPPQASQENTLRDVCAKENDIPTITTSDRTQIYFKDWGSGQPVVFSHGWPLGADAWDDQMAFLADRGYRCIALAYDRIADDDAN